MQFIKGDGVKSQAAQKFQVSRASVYNCLKMNDVFASQGTWPCKLQFLGLKTLKAHIEDYQDKKHSERARHFRVSRHCLWYNRRKLEDKP